MQANARIAKVFFDITSPLLNCCVLNCCVVTFLSYLRSFVLFIFLKNIIYFIITYFSTKENEKILIILNKMNS
jgi:hypothetical protein